MRKSKLPRQNWNALTATEYEKAVLQRLRTIFWDPQFVVKHNVKLPGKKSRKSRQVDICVFEVGVQAPILTVHTKRHIRPLDLDKVGSTIALVQDIGGLPSVMVASSGFSGAAENHLACEEIETLVITIEEAQGLGWIPEIERRFAADRAFREVSGHLVEAIRTGDVAPFLETDVPYEEWLALIAVGQYRFPEETVTVLKALAREHFDDGMRFNAVILLDEVGQLDPADVEHVARREQDPDALEALHELLGG
jgi:hypothetical protein